MSIFKKEDLKFCSVPIPDIDSHKGAAFDYTSEQIDAYKQSQTHPSILVTNKFGGHDFWLATTPYPSGVGVFENPCIYYADYQDDGTPPVVFTPINGTASGNYTMTTNPIVKVSSASEINSDPDLILVGNKMYLISRNNNPGNFETYAQESIDGQAWTPRSEYIWKGGTPEKVSPSFLYDSDGLHAYCITGSAGNYFYNPETRKGHFNGIQKWDGNDFTASGGWQYTAKVDLAGARERLMPWHFDVFKYNDNWYMVLCAKEITSGTHYMYLYLAESSDGLDFYIYSEPLFDGFSMYRPTACVDSNGELIIYISTQFAIVDASELPNGESDVSADGRYIGMLHRNFDGILAEIRRCRKTL